VAVIDMLTQLQASGDKLEDFIARVKDKDAHARLMGFGHRVYKNFDPRAKIIKEACHALLKKLGVNDPMLELAMRLEEIALKDEYFVKRKLYPNVDYYSGIIMRALGIPTSMFTVMFAIGRLPGWIAHWREVRIGGSQRIDRPRQVYTGAAKRAYLPMELRK
jgi:citrate synthase